MSIRWKSGRPYVEVYDPAVGRKRHVKAREFAIEPAGHGASRQTLDRWARNLERVAKQELGDARRVVADEDADAFARRWPADFPRGESTNAVNAQRLRAFLADFPGRPLRGRDAIDRAEARAWIQGGIVAAHLRPRARRWTAAAVLPGGDVRVPPHRSSTAPLRAMFNDAIGEGLADENPFAALGLRQSRGRRDIDWLTRDEVHALADLAVELDGPAGAQLRSMVLWGAYTAMRTGEVFAARYSALHGDVFDLRVQFNRRLARETEPKHGSAGRIFVPEPARAAVLELPRRLGDDLMFRTKRGRQFRQESFSTTYWAPLRAAFTARLPADHWLPRRVAQDPSARLDFYELRHFGAAYMLNVMGVEPWVIAKQLRHSNTRLILELYGHPDTDYALRAMRGAWAENVHPLREVSAEVGRNMQGQPPAPEPS